MTGHPLLGDPSIVLMPIDMAGRKMTCSLVFSGNWTYNTHVVVSHGGREALWSVTQHRRGTVRWVRGDRHIKPSSCRGAANYIHWYVQTHVKNIESLAR